MNLEYRAPGRPKGSVRKPRLADYCTPEQIQELVTRTLAEAADPDKFEQRKWLLDQYFGKAAQSVFTEDEEGNTLPILVQFINGTEQSNPNTNRV